MHCFLFLDLGRLEQISLSLAGPVHTKTLRRNQILWGRQSLFLPYSEIKFLLWNLRPGLEGFDTSFDTSCWYGRLRRGRCYWVSIVLTRRHQCSRQGNLSTSGTFLTDCSLLWMFVDCWQQRPTIWTWVKVRRHLVSKGTSAFGHIAPQKRFFARNKNYRNCFASTPLWNRREFPEFAAVN